MISQNPGCFYTVFHAGIPDSTEMPRTDWPRPHDVTGEHSWECSCFHHISTGICPWNCPSQANISGSGAVLREQPWEVPPSGTAVGVCKLSHIQLPVLALKDSKTNKKPQTKKQQHLHHRHLKIPFPELWKICCSLSKNIIFLWGKLCSWLLMHCSSEGLVSAARGFWEHQDSTSGLCQGLQQHWPCLIL